MGNSNLRAWVARLSALSGALAGVCHVFFVVSGSQQIVLHAPQLVEAQSLSTTSALAIPLQTATIPEIDAHRGTTPTLFHLQEDPTVLVLDFPDLHPQARMLNRIAALVEKAGMPRDRVVTEPELEARIRATGGDPDGYYYGHDYKAADVARFFRLAAAGNVPLNPYETWLGDLLEQQGWLKPDATGALVSIPGISAAIDPASRTTIFRHELSHAVYFTDPAYVALTHRWWTLMLGETERAAIRAFLAKEGYDTANEELMENEGQAFFIHTRDPRYFRPSLIGIGPAREAILRGTFVDAIPEPWLRDSALSVAPVTRAEPAALTGEPSSAPGRPPLHDRPAGEAPP